MTLKSGKTIGIVGAQPEKTVIDILQMELEQKLPRPCPKPLLSRGDRLLLLVIGFGLAMRLRQGLSG